MGFFDELQNKASEMLGGASDIGSDVTGSVGDAAGSVTDAGADLSNLSADMQEQITQYAQDNNVSIEAAKEHFLGGGQ